MNVLKNFVFSTAGVVTVLLVAALWMWRRPGSAVARRSVIATAVFYTLASSYVVPQTIGHVLAAGYVRFDASHVPPGPVAVAVIGAGSETIGGWDDERLSVLNGIGAARVLEAWRVWRLLDPTWIVSSGGLPDPRDPSVPGAILMRNELVRLGVPSDRVIVEARSHDTHDEAVLLKTRLASMGVAHVVIVTSDIHMRRAMGAFRAQGLLPIPAIAPDPRATMGWLDRWRPTGGGLSFSQELAHELLGIPYYWARGWWRP